MPSSEADAQSAQLNANQADDSPKPVAMPSPDDPKNDDTELQPAAPGADLAPDDDPAPDDNLPADDEFQDMAERDRRRRLQTIKNDAYREGADAGRLSIFQRDFDIGYATGHRNAQQLGRYEGMVRAYEQLFRPTDEAAYAVVDLLIANPRRAHCVLCTDKQLQEQPLADVQAAQKADMKRKVDELERRYRHVEDYCDCANVVLETIDRPDELAD